MPTWNTPHPTVLFLFLAFLLLALSQPSQAQSCQFHRDCGSGQLCDGIVQNSSGTCRSAESVLSQDGSLFWVNQSGGSDNNPGTRQQPWKTISRATRSGILSPGDAVLIRAGTYREEVRPREGGTASGGFVTFAAYPGDDVTVTGADVVNRPNQNYNGWQQQGDGSWRHAWIWDALPSEGVYEAERRRELLVDNGQVLLQIGGSSRPTLQNGQFWVQGTDTHPTAVFLKTFNGSNPNERTIEVGQRDRLFYSFDEGGGGCGGGQDGYYRVIGLHFTHATTKRQRMAVCPGRRGSRLEGITADWNNAGGIKLGGQGHLVRESSASHNGIEGIGGNCNGCTVEHSVVSYNNWKPPVLAAHGGGGKWTQTTNTVIRYNTFVSNDGSAIWFDNNSNNNHIIGNRVDRSMKQGIQIEHHSDYNQIYNNVITRTRYYSRIWNGIGISISVSGHAFVAYNTIMMNDGVGLRVAGDNRDDATYATVYNNLLVQNRQAADDIEDEGFREIAVLGKGPNNGMSEWERINTHRFGGNAYPYLSGEGNPARAVFQLAPSGPRDSDGSLYTNAISEWRSVAGYDPNGMVASPSLPTIVDVTNVETGWMLSPLSQFAGHAVALPAGFEPILTDLFGNPRPASGGSPGAHEVTATLPSGGEGGDPPSAEGIFGESGRVTVRQANADEWHTVSFESAFADPVVVMGPPSYNGPHTSTVRVRNVTPSSFQFQIDEWDYNDGRHTRETLSYLVVEAGIHTLADGTRFKAGHVGGVDEGWTSVAFPSAFSSRPVVLAQCASVNGPAAVVTRLQEVTETGFRVRLQEEEGNDGTHAPETVDYIAIKRGSGGASGVEASLTGDTVTNEWTGISFARTYSQPPAFLAALQTYDGDDPTALRYQNLTTSGVSIRAEEEQSGDSETDHTTEEVGYLVLRPGQLSSSAQVAEGPGGAASKSDEGTPEVFALEGNYPNPFAQRTTIRYTLGETVTVRLEVYDTLGRRVALLAEGLEEAGAHEVAFDASGLPSGVYLYRLQAGSFVAKAKMVRLN